MIRRRNDLVSILCLCAAACTSPTNSAPGLLGKWGAVNHELVATSAGVRYKVHCLDIFVSAASLSEDGGIFSGRGAIAPGVITGRPATIRVTLRGDTALVWYSLQLADSSYSNRLSPPDTLISGQSWIEGHRDCPA